MKGIILAGGKGTRLYPATLATSKQLLPVYNKPMVYYPLSTLMMAGIREILIISTPEDRASYERLLGSGARLGVRFSYLTQEKPKGLADAFILGKDFVGKSPAALILGDNIFFGHDVPIVVAAASEAVASGNFGAAIFGYPVRDPERYGVVELCDGQPVSIEEKPAAPKSKLAVPGLYFYGPDVTKIAASIIASPRGELEITDVNRVYMNERRLGVFQFGRGTAWLDAGTHESLLQASNFVQAVEERQGMLIGSPEEVAYRNGFIKKTALNDLADGYGKTPYADYLRCL